VAQDLVAAACEEPVQVGLAGCEIGQYIDGHGFGFFFARPARILARARARSSAVTPPNILDMSGEAA